MKTDVLSVDMTGRRYHDLTKDVRRFIEGEGEGIVNVFAPHATAGIALFETGSGSETDLDLALDRLLPKTERYVHSHGSPGHGADHLLPVFVSPSLSIPVIDGELALGTWHSIVLIDTNRDNPRRNIRLSFLGS